MSRVAATRDELAAALGAASELSRRRAVVMTMGALHDGHMSLVRLAREQVGPAGHVTVTIFVNPLQFGTGEDLGRYPRTLGADLELCDRNGVDLVFTPGPEAVYPQGSPRVTVDPGVLGAAFEGEQRPEHFRGVLTVVLKLLHLTRPQVAVFGEKDYQQLALIRQLVRDLDVDVTVVGAPISRDPDGLAASSRNRYLSAAARTEALLLPAAITAGQGAAAAGADADSVVQAARRVLQAGSMTEISYVAVTDQQLGPAPTAGPARLILAAIVDGTRLLDNARIVLGGAGG